MPNDDAKTPPNRKPPTSDKKPRKRSAKRSSPKPPPSGPCRCSETQVDPECRCPVTERRLREAEPVIVRGRPVSPQDDGRCRCEHGWLLPSCVRSCTIAQRMIRGASVAVANSMGFPDHADDTAQEVTLYLTHRYAEKAFPTAWLRRRARWKLRDILVRPDGPWHDVSKKFVSLTRRGDNGEHEYDIAVTEDDARDVVEALEERLSILTPIEALIVMLRHGVLGHEELTFSEIAQLLRRTTGKLWSVERVTRCYISAMERMKATR